MPSVSFADITTDLVGYWNFDEGGGIIANDSSGNENNGILMNGSIWTTGRIKGAIQLDGINDYVNIGDPPGGSLDFGINSFSYAMWVYVNNSTGNYDISLWKGGSNAKTNGYDMELGTDNWSAYISDGLQTKSGIFGTEVLGQWVHLAVVVNREINKLYVYKNGSVIDENGTDLTGLGSVSGTASMSIGSKEFFFSGIIDDVRIYNKALNNSDIVELYNYQESFPILGSSSSSQYSYTDIESPSIPEKMYTSTLSSSQIYIHWTNSSDNISVVGYKVYRNGVEVATTKEASYLDTNLTPSTPYLYSVIAYDEAGNFSTNSTQISATTSGTIPAFPGAEGFGSTTIGGRGGRIIEVTNLNDSGHGSFRQAVEGETGPRIIIFKIGGTMELKTPIFIKEANSYLTIAGQTAPGDGIQLKNYGIQIRDGAHDIIIRYLRIRPGLGGVLYNEDGNSLNGESIDGLLIWGNNGKHVYNVIADHLSIEWAIDENVNVWEWATDITLQWSIFAEGANEGHPKGRHSMGLLVGGINANNISVHHSLFANNGGRNPLLSYATVDFRNNLIYNWFNNNAASFQNEARVNFIGNHYISGPESASPNKEFFWFRDNSKIYLNDNYGPNCPFGCSIDEWVNGTAFGFSDNGNYGSQYKYNVLSQSSFPTPTIKTDNISNTKDLILKNSGAILPVQDDADDKIIQDVLNRTGSIGIGSVYPVLKSGDVPIDTDKDGIPNNWEASNGLNPNNPSDANGDINNNYYTDIEDYLNWLISTSTNITTLSNTSSSSLSAVSGGGSIPGNINPGVSMPNSGVATTTATSTVATTATTSPDDEISSKSGVDEATQIVQHSMSNIQPILTKPLKPKSEGGEIKQLQEFLSRDKEIYPEGLITGYYGNLTVKAVQRFQKKHGIVSEGTPETTGYGIVGPKTIARLNELSSHSQVLPEPTTVVGSAGVNKELMIIQLKQRLIELMMQVMEMIKKQNQ